MVACLQLGAADYMIKPLRHNELRNLWARVYWWRRVGPCTPNPVDAAISSVILHQIVWHQTQQLISVHTRERLHRSGKLIYEVMLSVRRALCEKLL